MLYMIFCKSHNTDFYNDYDKITEEFIFIWQEMKNDSKWNFNTVFWN